LKKTFSIFFLALFLFNVGGHYLVFWALRLHANQRFISIINSGDYAKDETIELKIPLSMPYPLHPRGAQRIDGEFEIDGKNFHLVEQSLHNDTLHIILIRHIQEENLVDTMTDYANLSNDLPSSAQKTFNLLGKLSKDYNTSTGVSISQVTSWYMISFAYGDFIESILKGNSETDSPPPRA